MDRNEIGGKLLIYSKTIIGDDTNCELVEWISKDFGPNGSFNFPLITNHGKGQKNQVKVCANNIKQAFIWIKKGNTLESNSLSLAESPL